MGSGLIREKAFAPARPHGSKLLDKLLSGDGMAVFGDSAYSKKEDKQKAREQGVYYGVLDKGTRKRKRSPTQKKNNKKKSDIRAKAEHPFAFMKQEPDYKNTVAKTIERNNLRFTMNCILYNIFRTGYLFPRQS